MNGSHIHPQSKSWGSKIIELSAIKKVLWTRKLEHTLKQLNRFGAFSRGG